ncbi:MAG TPA: hypothetical protein VJ165_03595, partial [candidate division Zixibacteria bacterium]|nr:hypothetical protein [candidate division Zixibacteria bacterium]
VDFIFRGGPTPREGCVAALATANGTAASEIAEVGWGNVQSVKERVLIIPLQANSYEALAGVSFRVEFDPQVLTALEPQLTERTRNLQLFYSVKGNQMTIGILDLKGQNYIIGGNGALVNLRFENRMDSSPDLSSLRIITSELVNPQAHSLQTRIVKGTVSPR